MKHFIFLIILFIATSTFAQEPLAVRAEAFNLLKSLQIAEAISNFPQEYSSFTATLNQAEQLYASGAYADAEQLFSLVILKGKLLLNSLSTSPPAATIDLKPSSAVFTAISSSLPVKPAQPPQADMAPRPTAASAVNEEPYTESKISERIVGGKGIYTVRKGDSLRLIASRLGVRLSQLTRLNHLKTDAILTPGQRLKYNNRRIVPKSVKNGIIINIADRSLYLFRNNRLSARYPVALGIAKKKESTAWQTPVGRFQIVDKKENPTWNIPPSIQKEMEENGEEVVESVPPGPKNPLGKYALRTDLAGILIHSTTKPASINSYSSHGCIRVMPEDMVRLFKSVAVPTQGEIIYQPVKVAVTGKGRVFLEVNRDSYEKVEDMAAEVRKAINRQQAGKIVSWQLVNRMTNEKSGIAEEVTLAEMPD